MDTFNEIIGPVQNGVGVKGGISITVFGVQLMMAANPDFGVIKGDIKNGYNEASREHCLRIMKETGKLNHILAFSHALLNPVSYIGIGSGARVIDAGFKSCEGFDQGALEAGPFFALTVNPAFQNMHQTLAEKGGGVLAIMDDHYAMADPETLSEANNKLKSDLKVVGLDLQPKKSACYIREGLRDERWDEFRGEIPNGKLDDEDEECVDFGIEICNVPFGTEGFVKGYLNKKQTRIVGGFDRAKELLDPAEWPHPDIPTQQMLFLLTLACFQFQPDYWTRHIRPDFTDDFTKDIDEAVMGLVQMSTGLNFDSLPDFVKERIRLPICMKGCGPRSANSRRHAQYVGAISNCFPNLIDRKDQRGNVIEGRLNLPSVIEAIGEESFSFPIDRPFATFLSKLNGSNLVRLKYA